MTSIQDRILSKLIASTQSKDEKYWEVNLEVNRHTVDQVFSKFIHLIIIIHWLIIIMHLANRRSRSDSPDLIEGLTALVL